MPCHAWLTLPVATGSVVGSLLMLKDTARKVPLTDEQKTKIRQRNAEMDAKEAQDR